MEERFGKESVPASQPRAFTESELVACPACSRANAPTRANCLYCGAETGITVEAEPTPAFALPETDAQSMFHIVLPTGSLSGQELSADFAPALNLSAAELKVLLSGPVAPLYSGTAAQAQATSEKLRKAGIEPVTVTDEQLNLATEPKPIAALTLADNSLTGLVRRTGSRAATAWDEIELMVLGRLYFTRNEVEQKRRSKQVLEERQLTIDETVLDIYPRADDSGWRIRAASFDFSCLGAEKKSTAFENFSALVDLLRRNASLALFDDRYARMRPALNKVWPPEPGAQATERRRTATRRIEATTTVNDNELQFTRYSRLLRHFQQPETQNDASQT